MNKSFYNYGLKPSLMTRISGFLFCLFSFMTITIPPQVNAQERVYKVSYDSAFFPLSGVKDGAPYGMTVDILTAAANKANLKIQLIPVADRLGSLKNGTADATFPSAVTGDSQKLLDFSKPLMITGGALFVLVPQPTPTSLDQLNGKTIVTQGTGPLASYIRRVAPGINLVTTDDYAQSMSMLVNGTAQAAALNLQVASQMAKDLYPGEITLPTQPFLGVPMAVAVTKGAEADFLRQINDGLERIDRDGTLKEIEIRWK